MGSSGRKARPGAWGRAAFRRLRPDRTRAGWGLPGVSGSLGSARAPGRSGYPDRSLNWVRCDWFRVLAGNRSRRPSETAEQHVGVGITIAHDPLHGSGRAGFPHPALALGNNAQASQRIGMTDRRQRQPASDETPHAVPEDAAEASLAEPFRIVDMVEKRG